MDTVSLLTTHCNYVYVFNYTDVKCTTKENDTPLMLAIRFYDSYTPQQCEKQGKAQRGELSSKILRFLLNYADVNAHNASGTMPLSLAVQKQNVEIVKLLLQSSDIQVNKCNFRNYAPLHFACMGEKLEIITILLNNGADIFSQNDKGNIPIHIACQKGHIEVIEHMLEKCSDDDKKNLLEAKDNSGNTLLLLAKETSLTNLSLNAFQQLHAKHKPNMHAKTKNQEGIFHKFAEDDDGELNAQLLENAEYSKMLNEKNFRNETPLHIACEKGHWNSVILFITR